MSCDTDNYKKQEIKDLYHVLYANRMNEGMSHQQAKRYAMDVASLRFGISNDRVRHILYDKESTPSNYKTFIYQNNLIIIKSLQELLEFYQKTKDTYRGILNDMEDSDEGVAIIQAKEMHLDIKIKKYTRIIEAIKEVNVFYSGGNR